MFWCSSEPHEMVKVIYKIADNVQGHEPDTEEEDADTKTRQEAQHTGFNTTGGRCYRVTAVCVVLLCVLLLSAVTVLWIKFTNLTKERDQLQTSYNNLTIERDQLQTRCNTLTKERKQCQSDFISDVIKHGWRFSSSSLYHISTEEKSWTESREDCRERGADLVIINSTEELMFIIKQLGGSREAWIGLHKDDTESKWKWLDGTELNNSTGFWAPGEPNNSGGNEDCGVIKTYSSTIGWNDKTCATKSYWICKKKV